MLSFPNSVPANVVALAHVLFRALDAPMIRTGEGTWPYSPDSLDFTQATNVSISLNAHTGVVAFKFAGPNMPTLLGTISLNKLEGQLVGAPNYINKSNAHAIGPLSTLVFGAASGGDATAITKRKSGVISIRGELCITQSVQSLVTFYLYRDYGLPGQVQLGAVASVAPGGVGAFNAHSSPSWIDVLPDEDPHYYTIVAVGSGGSLLSTDVGGANIQAFELVGAG